MTDFRALCIELTDCLEKADWPLRYRYVFRQWVDIARAALADGPAVPDGREPASVTGQPRPVPVSERLPGPEDCDTEGRYWGLINGCEAWVLGKGSPSTLNITHWLPAHALPVPGQEVAR